MRVSSEVIPQVQEGFALVSLGRYLTCGPEVSLLFAHVAECRQCWALPLAPRDGIALLSSQPSWAHSPAALPAGSGAGWAGNQSKVCTELMSGAASPLFLFLKAPWWCLAGNEALFSFYSPWRCPVGIYPRISMQEHPQGVSGWDWQCWCSTEWWSPLSEHWSFFPGVVTPWCYWSHLGIFNVENLISI